MSVGVRNLHNERFFNKRVDKNNLIYKIYSVLLSYLTHTLQKDTHISETRDIRSLQRKEGEKEGIVS